MEHRAGASPSRASFDEALLEQVRRTPWLLSSVVIHLILLAVLSALSTAPAPRENPLARIDTTILDKTVEPVYEPEPPPATPEIDPEPVANRELDPDADPTPTEDDPGETDPDARPEIETGPVIEPSGPAIIGVGPGGPNPFGRPHGGPGGPDRPGPANVAVEWGLQWLASHQSEDGSWDCDDFMVNCKKNQCSGKGHPLYDVGVSGLALLAFLGAGHGPDVGSYKDTVKRGLHYLAKAQDPEGCFGGRSTPNFTYGHAIATLAMAEGLGLSGNSIYRRHATRGLQFVQASKNPYRAWRYGVRPGDDDSSVTGWMIMALHSAALAGLQVDPQVLKDARNFLDEVTNDYGRVGYTQRGTGPMRPEGKLEEFPAEHSESLTAVGILSRVFLGEDPKTSEPIRKGAALLAKRLPRWEKPKLDFYYWYYGSLAAFQVGGETWKAWRPAMESAILAHQRRDGDEKGSWDPEDCWGEEGGRVYSTAVLTLCLEVYYRYPRVFGVK
jgi:hypothetical protein